MSYTHEVKQTVREGLRKLNSSTLASLLKKVDIGQLLEDLSELTIENVSSNGSSVITLSKIPLGPVHLCKADGSAGYTQVPDAITPSSNQFRVTDRKTGQLTGHAGLASLSLTAYYLGITKPEDTSTYNSALEENLDKTHQLA